MSRFIKAFVSSVLILCLCLSLFGCKNTKKLNAEAETLSKEFFDAVLAGDTGKLITYINDPSVTENDIEEIINPSGLNSEQEEYLRIIRESMNYTIDYTVFDKELNIAFVNASFTYADCYSEEAVEADDLDAFTAAMVNAPDYILSTCAEVDFSGETPKIIDAYDVIGHVYGFASEDNRIMPGLLSDYYTDGSLVLAPKGVYTNTDTIGVRLNFDASLYEYRFVPGVTYTVSMGDNVLYTSDVIRLEDNSVRLDYSAEVFSDIDLNEDGFLEAGTYTFMVFDEHYNDIARFDCTVENEEIEKEEIVFKELKNDYYLANLVYEFKDSDLMANSYVFMSGWWDYDGTSVGKSAFASNTKTLGFSLAVSSDNDTELYYEYYFSEKASFKGINDAEPLFESSCKPSIYDDQSCYDLDFTPEELKPGYYGLVVYGDASKKHIVFQAACLVVKETSDVID